MKKTEYQAICTSQQCSGNSLSGKRINVPKSVVDCPKCGSALFWHKKLEEGKRLRKNEAKKELIPNHGPIEYFPTHSLNMKL